MHSEYYIVTKEATDILNEVKKNGKAIVAVGTTTVRTLETIRQKHDKFVPDSGETNILFTQDLILKPLIN